MSDNVDLRIDALRREIREKRDQLVHLYRQRAPEPVADYDLVDSDGTAVRLSDLFAGDAGGPLHSDLILIHNMGRSCAYCTLWADGFTGLIHHITERAAFALSSPDPPEVQCALKAERGWNFRMVSTAESPLTRDLGYLVDGELWPGVSTLHLNEDGTIVRTNRDVFGPLDDYNALWHFFSLLPGGAGDWQPRPA